MSQEIRNSRRKIHSRPTMISQGRKIIHVIENAQQTTERAMKPLPTLTVAQQRELSSLKTSVDKAECMIRVLGMGDVAYKEDIDPECIKIANDLKLEERATDLYWNIKMDCENNGLPLFSRLSSARLLEVMHPEYVPLF